MEESPIQKAFREFAMADPNDCDREWEACLALGRDKAASVSSPTNSTSSPPPTTATEASSATSALARPREPRDTALAAIPTAPAASRAVLNTKDELTPGARCIYELLVGSPATSAPSTTTDGDVSARCCFDSASASVLTASAMPWTDPCSVTPTTCSTICRGAVTSAAPTPSSTVASSAPTSASALTVSEVYTKLADPTTLNLAPTAADIIIATDLAASVPMNCSSKSPTQDDDISESVLIPSATQALSTTIGNVLSELTAPMVGDKALEVDSISDTTPTVAACLLVGPYHNSCEEDLVSKSLTLSSAPTFFNSLPGNLPSLLCAPMSTCLTNCSGRSLDMPSSLLEEAYKFFNDVSIVVAIMPWPPPSWKHARPPLIRGHDSCHDVQQKCGKEYLVVWELESPFTPTMQDDTCNQGKQGAAWPEVRNVRHQFERTEVVKLKPPWATSVGMCMNLPLSKYIQSLGSFRSDKRGPGINGCLGDVLCELKPPCLPPPGLCMNLPTTAANSAMVKYIHCKGPRPPDPDESDCVASRYVVNVSLCLRLEEGQPNACNVMLHPYKIYSTILISWKDTMLVVNQWVSTRFIPFVWNSFEVDLNPYGYNSMHLTDIQTTYILMQWKIPWLFSCPLYICLPLGQYSMEVEAAALWYGAMGGRESLYGLGNFHWKNAWSLSYHFSPSCFQTRPHCAILLVQLNYSAIYQEIWIRFMVAKLISAGLLMIFLENRCEEDVDLCLLNCSQQNSSECSQWKIAWLLRTGIVTITLCLDFKLGLFASLRNRDWSLWRYPSVDHMMRNSWHISQCAFELNQWEIAWSLSLEYLDSGNHRMQNILQGFLSANCLNLGHKKWSWDPGIWEFFCCSGCSHTLQLEEGSWLQLHPAATHTTLTPTLSSPPSATTTTFTWYQFFLTTSMTSNNGYQHDPAKIDKTHAPWDPGGSTWTRLGVKPNFKEGGLSTTALLAARWADTLGPWPGDQQHIYEQDAHGRLGLERNGRAASAEAGLGVLRVSCCSFLLCRSSSFQRCSSKSNPVS